MTEPTPANTSLRQDPLMSRVNIVLVETSHPGNIGAAARAMKTMGLFQLTLVAPKSFPNIEADERSSGAQEILANARVVDDFTDAVADCHRVYGASARLRQLSMETLTPRAVAEQALTALRTEPEHRIAIVFGRERSGLTNQEISRCHALLHVPTNPEFWSLNLAAAVQVAAYELRMAYLGDQANLPISHNASAPNHVGRRLDPVARGAAPTSAQMEGFYSHLLDSLTRSTFLDPSNPRLLVPRLRNLFNRADPDQEEVQILRGILTAFCKTLPELSDEQANDLEQLK